MSDFTLTVVSEDCLLSMVQHHIYIQTFQRNLLQETSW